MIAVGLIFTNSGCDCMFLAQVRPIHSETGEILEDVEIGESVYWNSKEKSFNGHAQGHGIGEGWVDYSPIHGRCNTDKVVIYKEGFEPLKMKIKSGSRLEVKLTPIK